MKTKRFSKTMALLCVTALLHVATWRVSHVQAQDAKQKLSLAQVGSITSEQLARRDDYQPGDLLTNSDVREVLKALAAAGWRPPDQKDILAHTLPEGDKLVRTLSTDRGKLFMRKVAEDDLIFDRLDRVSRAYGGERMITDLAKLPDGYKYAKAKRPDGVPGFLDLLPKTASGKKRSIKDYDKPTGRIYSEKQLLERLENSYRDQPALPAT